MKEEIKYLHNGILMSHADAFNNLQEKLAKEKQLDETDDPQLERFGPNGKSTLEKEIDDLSNFCGEFSRLEKLYLQNQI
ncbi:MAG: hypothetical protein KR126chlam5_01103 [Candidatus Anoxychlamydiales bacterium]|nr:hypothetical protein [Candidatus Anoxychlamydiales bacterium]